MNPAVEPDTAAADFIARWQAADGTELANYQLFAHQLAGLLGVVESLIALDRIKGERAGERVVLHG